MSLHLVSKWKLHIHTSDSQFFCWDRSSLQALEPRNPFIFLKLCLIMRSKASAKWYNIDTEVCYYNNVILSTSVQYIEFRLIQNLFLVCNILVNYSFWRYAWCFCRGIHTGTIHRDSHKTVILFHWTQHNTFMITFSFLTHKPHGSNKLK